MSTLGLSSTFDFWLLGILPPALAFSFLAIVLYFFAKRLGPASAALSALFSLVLLSIVPLLALSPMPKWWTVEWGIVSPVRSASDGRPEAVFLAPLANTSPSANASPSEKALSIEPADENRADGPPSNLHFAATEAEGERVKPEADSWTGNLNQGRRLIGILLIVGWSVALVRFALGLWAVAYYRLESVEITDSCALDLARSIADRIGFPRSVPLRQSTGIVSAATIGWLCPLILLPTNWRSWSLEELRVVLAHEIGHVARRDFPAWVLAQFSLALHFYHPLAHWLLSRLRRDQELAADLLGAELCGGREKYLVTLSQMILTQTSRPAPLFARPIFSARGTFLWRMKMLNAKNFTASTRLRGLHIFLLALLSILIGFGSAGVGIAMAQAAPQEASKAQTKSPASAGEKGLLKGRITAADTGKPVQGVMVQVLLDGESAPKNFLELVSDKEGQYSHEIPLGDLKLFGVYCPPGYYTQDEKTFDCATVSKNELTVVRDFSLQPGKPWALELAGYAGTEEKPAIFSARIDPTRSLFWSTEAISTLANSKGEGSLTIPGAGGHYQFRCLQRQTPNRLEIAPIDLKIEKGFDPTQVQADLEINPEDQSVRLKDKSGKITTVSGAKVVVRGGSAVLQFMCKAIPKSAAFKAEGVVRDGWLKPIAGAKITAAFLTDTGGGMSNFVAYSQEDGKFIMPEILLSSGYFKNDQRIKMVVTKSGYNGEESKELNLAEIQKSGIADFGTIRLKPGVTLKGKVVDNQLQPVQGAVVTCFDRGFAHSHLTARTDAEGKFQMPDLSYGGMRMWVNYGDQYGDDQFHFSEKSGEVILLLRYNRKN